MYSLASYLARRIHNLLYSNVLCNVGYKGWWLASWLAVVNTNGAQSERALAASASGVLQETLTLECKAETTQQRGQRSDTLQESKTKQRSLPNPLYETDYKVLRRQLQ